MSKKPHKRKHYSSFVSKDKNKSKSRGKKKRKIHLYNFINFAKKLNLLIKVI